MNARFFSAIVFLMILATVAAFLFSHFRQKDEAASRPQTKNLNSNQAKNMKITSPAFENNADIPVKYTCDGENASPPLEIDSVPSNAKSLALIVDDPDAPGSGGFVHWVIFNLDPDTKSIEENSKPESGIEGTNSSGKIGYTSPCPPYGTHHYFFKLFALDTMLNLDPSAKRENVEAAMEEHILEQAALVGLYKKN